MHMNLDVNDMGGWHGWDAGFFGAAEQCAKKRIMRQKISKLFYRHLWSFWLLAFVAVPIALTAAIAATTTISVLALSVLLSIL